jgi:hypothetical protein
MLGHRAKLLAVEELFYLLLLIIHVYPHAVV